MSPKKTTILILCLLLLALPAFAANSAYKVSPRIPLESWTYPALERVVALCNVKHSLAGVRPLTRLEAARMVSLAQINAGLFAVPPMVKQQLSRLQAEFRPELAYLGAENAMAVPSKLLRAAELKYTYQDGKDSASPGTGAHQFALNYNNAGRQYDNYHNGAFTLLGDVLLFDQLLLSWQPMVSQQDDDGSSYDTLSAVAAVSFAGVELSAGRQSLWWGPGRHGALILTDNAKPLDMVRLNNPSPLQLPWILKYLGPFSFDLFLSRPDDDRPVDDPYFSGLRFNIKPADWLELGASRTIMFGGKGKSVNASDFLTILSGKNLSGDDDNSNSLAGLDARILFPLLWGAQVYGELVGEDEAGGFFSRNSYMVGAFLPQLEPSGRLSLRAEYADTTRIDSGGAPVLYRHPLYPYRYEDQIMGHHVGTDATDLSFALGIDCTDRLALTIGLDFEERGKAQPVQEKHAQLDLSASWWMTPQMNISARYAYDRVKHWNFTDDDEDFYMAELGIGYSF